VLDHMETQVSAWVEWLRLPVEAPGALVIGAGVLAAPAPVKGAGAACLRRVKP
jgi:hypothetical protein